MQNAITDTTGTIADYYVLPRKVQRPEAFMTALRKRFSNTFWMECNDIYKETEKVIFVAAQPIAGIEVADLNAAVTNTAGSTSSFSFDSRDELWDFADKWMASIQPPLNESPRYNGLLGYCSYNAVQLAENILFSQYAAGKSEIPLLRFSLYRYLFIFRKSSSEIILINNRFEQERSALEQMKDWLREEESATPGEFQVLSQAEADCTETEFIDKVNRAKLYCLKGDTFQVVLSRKFSRKYKGDPWAFFLKLKHNDGSPYQFFADYGGFQITGISPETHFNAVNGLCSINPIAGTYKRPAVEEEERKSVEKLLNDPKENAEHIMLVDLARNDLNKISSKVHVSKFRTIEKYKYVLHMVSQVKGSLPHTYSPFRSVMDVFPAGTLSGAPKYRAMQIIDSLESSSRSFYGGLLGWIGFNKDVNTCIIIRSALFQNGTMSYRAGAGVVESSVPELELEEVNNKLRAISLTIANYQNL